MEEKNTVTKKLPERIKFQDQEMQQLKRSESAALYTKLYQADPINYAVGIIHKIEIDPPDGTSICSEEFVEFDSIGNRIVWKLDNYKQAIKLYRKLVSKHG